MCKAINKLKNKDNTLIKFENKIKIDLVIPMYYGDDKLKKELLILFLKYLRFISNSLLKNNIYLSFTIVGSDGQDSLRLFNRYLKQNIDDIYIEFNQHNISLS